ncbi:MAG: ATP-dependent Clp protease proteolytic subunit, partial [Planctomycetota bacterium]|nr:ATP-dependent Clp protease proteolytic subunit [Planctomycetota bacterium]
RVMLHQPWGGVRGTATDISIQAEEIISLREQINSIIVNHTGKEMEQIEADTDRDFYMSAREAMEYGIVDEVLESLKDTNGEAEK